MNAAQKYALFNLLVVVLTIVAILLLVPVLGGARAQGGFGLLGLLGLGVVFFRKRRGEILMDERDQMINRRSVMIAYSVFWVAFVGGCLSFSAIYGENGAVPVTVIQTSVWCGLMLVVAVMSIATLVQYGLDH